MSSTRRRSRLVVLALVATACLLPACGTVSGVGRDLQFTGKALNDASQSTADSLTGKR